MTQFDDRFTAHMLAARRPDGSLGIVLRNPNRDYGAAFGADRLVRAGNNPDRAVEPDYQLMNGGVFPRASIRGRGR